jgi:hypothetical protein
MCTRIIRLAEMQQTIRYRNGDMHSVNQCLLLYTFVFGVISNLTCLQRTGKVAWIQIF